MQDRKIFDRLDPQPEVRRNAENARDWEFQEEAAFLYRMAVLFRDRLVDPILRTDRSQVPDPVISFENLRNNNTLAAYTLNRNPQGLLHEITFNTTHYQTDKGKRVWRYGRWAQLETLLHEMLHLKQQKYGREPYKAGRSTHNREFSQMCKDLGLNVTPNVGSHFAVADEDSPFSILMKELGNPRPDDVPRAETGKKDWFEIGKKRKGTSTLKHWQCPECGLNVWIGIKGNPELIHHPCSERKGSPVFFIRADQEVHNQVIYQAGSDTNPKLEGKEAEPPAEPYYPDDGDPFDIPNTN